jgi:lysyl-tRNA synthetase class 2
MDNWQPSASLDTLKQRAKLLADIRQFFAQRHVMEVETPILSTAAPTAPYVDSFKTYLHTQGYYLHTSPEFAMKRLLAAGSGAIYQIAKVFRHGEQGKQHAPEFTMLEWYRPDFSLTDLMDEVDMLMQSLLASPPTKRLSYQEVIDQYLGIDALQVDIASLQALINTKIPHHPLDDAMDKTALLEILMSQLVEPQLAILNTPLMIYNFPPEQAQLAKIIKDGNGNQVAARFELYAGGMELANGYDELQDADILLQRFEADNQQRKQAGKPDIPLDINLLDAMKHGFPACSGVALGLDRLLMLLVDAKQISDVVSFDIKRV